MFNEFVSQVWTPSEASVVVTNNTDFSIDGSSKKITWTAATNEYVTISFTEIDLSTYEEISFYISMRAQLTQGNLFSLTIDGKSYNFTKDDFVSGKWKHVLIDCSGMGAITTITITSLVPGLTLFVDYIGYRKVTYNCDVDIITALKSHINLDYDQETYLSADVSIGDTSVSLLSKEYIKDNSVLQIDDGYGTIETVELVDKDLNLKTPFVNSFSNGDDVRVLCPVRGEDFDELEPDPICGVKVFDMEVDKQRTVELNRGGSKVKEYLGNLGILIYIDCSSKKKLFQMSREFNRKYGKEFEFLLDGELVDIYIETSVFSDDLIGNNPRMAYYYMFEPQPYLFVDPVTLDDITLDMGSMPFTTITEGS